MIGSSNAEPTVRVSRRVVSAKPASCTVISYGPTRRYGKRNRPSLSVIAVAVTFVSVCRAVTCAPETTPPDGSVTRPLTLAKLTVS